MPHPKSMNPIDAPRAEWLKTLDYERHSGEFYARHLVGTDFEFVGHFDLCWVFGVQCQLCDAGAWSEHEHVWLIATQPRRPIRWVGGGSDQQAAAGNAADGDRRRSCPGARVPVDYLAGLGNRRILHRHQP